MQIAKLVRKMVTAKNYDKIELIKLCISNN